MTTDLAIGFPFPDSLLPVPVPDGWFEFKKKLYDKTGVKLSLSYQSLYQQGSNDLGLLNEDFAWGGWLAFQAGWDAFRTGQDYEGSFVATAEWRHGMAGGAIPWFYGPFGVGSLWATDIAFDDWAAVPLFYWEQWFKKDVFVLRVGKQLTSQTYDFSRFEDSRTSFSSAPFTAHNTIPHPQFGQAVSFAWWPKQGSELYIRGTLSDMNGNPEDAGFDTFFDEARYFYGFEVGYFWKRNASDYDHVHLDLFYADERTEPLIPGLFNEAGGGFKLMGSKQWDRLVGFGSYTFSTAEGGGSSLSLARHTVAAGLAALKPAGIGGELGVGTAWMHPLDDALRDQFGGEVYWKLLLTPNLWITPGVQLIWNPSLDPGTDFVAVGQVKFRLFL